MAARGSVRKGENGSSPAQVCNQLAVWDVSYGYIGNVGQVTAKNLLVMVDCFQDITTYVGGDQRRYPGG